MGCRTSAGRAIGIFKTAVGDRLDLPLGELAALGFCQPDGTFITSLDDLRHRAVVDDQELEVVVAVQGMVAPGSCRQGPPTPESRTRPVEPGCR